RASVSARIGGSMARYHLLSQYIWPDGAPTAIYAEHLAERLRSRGAAVVLAGGTGVYREAARPRPQVTLEHLPHFVGRRGSGASVIREYLSVERAFRRYIRECVGSGDLVVGDRSRCAGSGGAPAGRRRGSPSRSPPPASTWEKKRCPPMSKWK